ncbi:DNA-directed RNA polymerase I subunit rpa49 [Paecilomyces lecythidis]|uniref:DNA-directed RNA polymerase I subunit rpa49 n=1 Tax=Paecilomyces lecythidis TaxID=3004212 RepID=A0ABR3X5Q1_9EURO
MAVDVAEKKRKRASDRHERPSKKPALEPQDLPPLKASVVEDESELAPVIVTTPGLKPPRKLPLHPYIKSRRDISSSSTRGRNPGIVSSEILLQSSEHPKLDFVGREADDDADAQLKHYIAVVDPVKKTWQFVEARKVTLRGVVRRLKVREDKEEEEEEEPQTIRAQRNALTDAFGTKQSRKAAQSVAENATLSNAPAGETNAVEAALLSSMPVDSLSVADKEKAVQAEIQAAKPLPQANLSASHPSDVYPLDVLVAGGVSTLRQLPNIKEWQDAVAAGGEVRVASRYVVNRVHAVAESGNITHLQILRYILLLLEFARCLRGGGKVGGAPLAPGSKRLPPRDDLRRILSSTIGGKASEKIPPSAMLPDPVIDSIRRKHAPQGSHLTKTDLTLLQTTICALSLHIPPVPAKDGGSSSQGGNSPNELATDPSDLRDDLRLDNQVIQQYFRELGCRIDKPRESEFAKWGVKGGKVEAAARRICRLRVPVEFPKVSRGARK